jgi:hypothetical protein
MIWLNVVTWPWPCGEVPMMAYTRPVGSRRTLAVSQPPTE